MLNSKVCDIQEFLVEDKIPNKEDYSASEKFRSLKILSSMSGEKLFELHKKIMKQCGSKYDAAVRDLRKGFSVECALAVNADPELVKSGVVLSFKELCKKEGVLPGTAINRMKTGCCLDEALHGRKKVKDHLGNQYTSIKEMVEDYGVSYSTYISRIRSGWSVEDSLLGKESYVEDDRGVRYATVQEMCEKRGVNYHTFRRKIRQGFELDEVLSSEMPGLKKKVKTITIGEFLRGRKEGYSAKRFIRGFLYDLDKHLRKEYRGCYRKGVSLEIKGGCGKMLLPLESLVSNGYPFSFNTENVKGYSRESINEKQKELSPEGVLSEIVGVREPGLFAPIFGNISLDIFTALISGDLSISMSGVLTSDNDHIVNHVEVRVGGSTEVDDLVESSKNTISYLKGICSISDLRNYLAGVINSGPEYLYPENGVLNISAEGLSDSELMNVADVIIYSNGSYAFSEEVPKF